MNMKITRLKSGGLITNYTCSSKCRHCLYRCSPDWPKHYINEKTTRNNLNKIKALGCHSMHIGGGEPLLNPDKLYDVIDVFDEEDMSIDYIETNSSWFQDHDSACDVLDNLLEHGMTRLLVSISPFHNEFIPFKKVKGVIHACHTTGMHVFPWIQEFYRELDMLDAGSRHNLAEFDEYFGDSYVESIPNRYWINPGGRALDFFRDINGSMPVDTILANNPDGCDELTDVDHFHVDLYGNYVPGLCSGFALHLDDLGQPVNEKNYPFINLLYEKGIRGFYELAINDYDFKQKSGYSGKCDLCADIRHFFVNKLQLHSEELQPLHHYFDELCRD